jgi:tRNA threonylcarbamoyladenosine biosynthesis protein TsaE
MIFESDSPEKTAELGRKFARSAKPGDVFALFGDLGAGKTVFAKAFASELEIESEITSPTFTLINEYFDGKIPFYHMDLYRISGEDDFTEIGGEEYLQSNGICLIEWSEKIPSLLGEDVFRIMFENLGADQRRITVEVPSGRCLQ